jgi:hypothetical protein
MENMDTAGVVEWLRSMKLYDAAAICFTEAIDGFVFIALLEETGGLDSIGITKAFDRAKVLGGVRRRLSEVSVTKLSVPQTMTHVVDQTTFASQLNVNDASLPSSFGSLARNMEEVTSETELSLSNNTEANTASQLQPFTLPREYVSWTDVTVAVHTMALRDNKQVNRHRKTRPTPRLQ